MTFANSSVLTLLLLLPAAVALLVWRYRARMGALRRLGDMTLTHTLFSQVSNTRRIWKSVDLDTIETQGVAIMVVLDISNSMEAQDIAPSRLQRAKLAVHDLFQGLAGNELGLILFAGEAFVQFPLTTDLTSAETFLNAVSTEAISHQGTAIEVALRLALNAFSTRNGASEIILLITDGENTEGDPMPVVDEAANQGITIYTLGYGDPDQGAPVPVYDETGAVVDYKTDQFGQVVTSRLNESILQEIADRTGGTYQRASAGGIEIVNLINEINQLEAGELDSRTEERPIERFGVFVALALLALSLEILLPETRSEAVA
jgi:Ca-activated chloride channel family protein